MSILLISLREAWNEMIAIGYQTREEHKNGQQVWQTYKEKYNKYTLKGYESGIPLRENFTMIID